LSVGALPLLALISLSCVTTHGSATAAPRRPRPVRERRVTRPEPPAPIGQANAERVREIWEAAVGGRGLAVAVSRGLGRVAVASGGSVALYELRTGHPAGMLPSCHDVLRGGLAFAGRKLLVVCEDGLELFDPVSKKKLSAPNVAPSKATAVSIAWPRVAIGHHDGVVRIYSMSGAPTIEIHVPGPPIDVKSLALSRDGSKVAVAWIQGSIWWWNTADPTTFHRLVRHESESDAVGFSDDGQLFAEEGHTFFTTVWSFAGKPAVVASLHNGPWEKRLLFTHDAKWLVRAGADGLDLAEVHGPRRLALDSRDPVADAAFDERATLIAAVDRQGRLTLWGVR
jgi:WD40 repeat protein